MSFCCAHFLRRRGTGWLWGALAALAWGLVNFGLLLWLPTALVAQGRSVAAASALIAKSTLIAAPTIVLCAWLFSVWSTKWSLVAMSAVMVLGMLGLAVPQPGAGALAGPLVPLAPVILGSSGVISMLLPYAAENYPLRIRGRAIGWVAACSKLGGLAAQGLSVLAGVPPFGAAVLTIAVPALGSTPLIALFGRESRGRSLGDAALTSALVKCPCEHRVRPHRRAPPRRHDKD